MSAAARELGVPLRHLSPGVQYCGNFYGQTAEGDALPEAISVTSLLKIVAALPGGVTELGCHPGDGSDLRTMYRDERARETRVLCDPRVREALEALDVDLVSFAYCRANPMREEKVTAE